MTAGKPLSSSKKANYKTVFGKRGATLQSGTYVLRDGELVLISKTDMAGARQADSVDLVSEATGIHPRQIPEFERAFGHLGVKYTPTGEAVYRDRRAKLAVLKARGFHDKNETSG